MLRTESGIYIPPSVTSVAPPKFKCVLCGWTGTADQGSEYEAHVARCARKKARDVEPNRAKDKAPGIFGDEAGDPEYTRWVRKHGRVA